MYSFDVTSEQKMLIETVHRYAEDQLRAVYRESEETRTVPAKAVQRGWELGLLPGSIDPNYGGFGDYSALTSALFLEELGWGDVGITLHLLSPNLFALPVALFGTLEQKAHYLPRFCTESFAHATAAITEPAFLFDPAELSTHARREGEGYLITGKKSLVPLAAEAEVMLVYAEERGATQAFVVPTDLAGLAIHDGATMMGARALSTYDVTLEEVRVPRANRLGGLKGIRINRLLTVSRMSVAALAVGQARAAYEYALVYAKERQAFGEAIAQRQSIAFMLANMAIEIEAARLMVWEAAYLFDNQEDATRAAVLAAEYATKTVLDVTDGAVQILGGHGYSREHPVELWLRNGRGFATWTGLVVA